MSRLILIDDDAPDAAATYIGDVDSGSTFAFTHSLSIAIGAVADASEGQRLVAVAVHIASSTSNPNPVISAATIGGISASWGLAAGAARATGRYSVVWIWALVPTGTSATVSVTLSENSLVRFRSFRVVNLLSTTPGHNDEDSNVGNITSLVSNIDVERGGVALAACTGFGVDTWTISGVTQDYSVSAVWSADGRIVGGHLDATADETARAITIGTGSFATTAIALAVLAFR